MGLTCGTARLPLVGDTSGLSTRLPTLPMPQWDETGNGSRKFLLWPRVKGRVCTEVAIGYAALQGGKVLCRKKRNMKVYFFHYLLNNELMAKMTIAFDGMVIISLEVVCKMPASFEHLLCLFIQVLLGLQRTTTK